MEKNIYKNLMIATDGSDCAKSAFKVRFGFFWIMRTSLL